ncbi:class I SAM-dependent methyltransferase [Tautonia plasticadhaerens]|uniref:Methyltransferase n=1 Tax=Tautonia plasticadhaerens TaxID=2527974 RepID=A0A518GV39_9BACT|nr:methyltransferase [Tautonia plasticadhaerens]QDV32452.1 Putative methyltransferase [Tautonia plasticadhaerens]
MMSVVAPDSRYTGPEATPTLEVGGRAIRLCRPADPDRLLDDPVVLDWNARDDYMPYWAYLWPGAFLLAEAVAVEPWGPDLTALELGCGLGLAGLVGLDAGLSRVVFTDYDLAPLRFVGRSATANGFGPDRVSTDLLDWRDPPDARYPVILGADVLYERRLVPLVVGVLRALLAPDGVALVSGPYRVATEDLGPALSAAGLRSESSPIRSEDEHGRPLRGTLHRIRRR